MLWEYPHALTVWNSLFKIVNKYNPWLTTHTSTISPLDFYIKLNCTAVFYNLVHHKLNPDTPMCVTNIYLKWL